MRVDRVSRVRPLMHDVHDRVIEFIRDRGAATFESLALAVFAHQYALIAPYRRLCDRHGRTPDTVADWREVPIVPVLAFKHEELCCGAPSRVFLSSGTTQGAERRSRHAMPDVRLYHAAALTGLKEFVFPDVPDMRLLSLIPSASEWPESSLAQMVTWAGEAFGAPGSATFAHADRLDWTGLVAALRQSERDGEPVCIMTTTGALIHFFERCRGAGWSFRLPHGSRLVDTGGLKGAPRPLSRAGLLQAVWTTWAIPGYFVANEYGMTELSSQFYDNVIRDRWRGRVTHRAKAGPHWVRTRVLDPGTLRDVAPGESGLLCHVDLANAGSALAVLTEDVGRATPDGFELRGRAASAETRGCSLALAEFLA